MDDLDKLIEEELKRSIITGQSIFYVTVKEDNTIEISIPPLFPLRYLASDGTWLYMD